MPTSALPRLLLVETVIDAAYRGILFPAIHGLTRRAGAESRWLRFAALRKLRLNSDGVSLPPQDRSRLRAFIRQFNPSHVLFSLLPSEAFVRSLDVEALPRRYGYIGRPRLNVGKTKLELTAISNSISAAASFLGLSNDAPAALDYGWVAGNKTADSIDPNPFVIVSVGCRYQKPLASNPFFHNVDLTSSVEKGGCSFCVRPRYMLDAEGDAPPSLEQQFLAVENTCPRPGGCRLQIWMLGEAAVREIDDIARLIIRLKMTPADFKFETRANLLMNEIRKFEDALRILEGTGHRLGFSDIGIENFSSAELERYNKGVTPSQNLQVIKRLYDWATRFPNVFIRDKHHSGLSMITLNPWTQPEDLDLNVTVAEMTGLGKVPGSSSHLRLMATLPLEAKARQEGLVITKYDDPILRKGRKNFYAPELSWRFKAPVMESIRRIMFRLTASEQTADRFSREVRKFVREGGEAGQSISHLAHLIMLAAQQAAWKGTPAGPTEVLSGARSLAASGRETAHGMNPPPGQFFWKHVAQRIAVAGTVPWRFHPAGEGRAMTRAESRNPVLLLWTDKECWVELKLQSTTAGRLRYQAGRFVGDGPDVDAVLGGDELVLGRDTVMIMKRGRRHRALSGRAFLWWHRKCFQADFWRTLWDIVRATPRRTDAVRQIMFRLAGNAATGNRPPKEDGLLISRLSRIRTLAAQKSAGGMDSPKGRFFWKHVSRRIAITEVATPQSHPAGVDRTGARADSKNPVLLLWATEECWVELKPESKIAERFRYRAGRFSGTGPDVEAVLEGDELILGSESVLIMKKGSPYASLSGRAFLWWHEKTFQTDFWRALWDVVRTAQKLPSTADGASELIPA